MINSACFSTANNTSDYFFFSSQLKSYHITPISKLNICFLETQRLRPNQAPGILYFNLHGVGSKLHMWRENNSLEPTQREMLNELHLVRRERCLKRGRNFEQCVAGAGASIPHCPVRADKAVHRKGNPQGRT